MIKRFHACFAAGWRSIPGIALLVLLLIVSCVSTEPVTENTEPPRNTAVYSFEVGVPVAIFDFEVRSSTPGYEALAVDVSAALTEAFLAGGVVRPLERAALEKVLGELELSMSGLVDPGTAARVGKLAGARFVMLGTAAVVGAQTRLSCRIVDVETAEIVYARSVFGNSSDIFKIELELAALVEKDFSS
jgi:curli biogenesis system outer membrane secretion channel CsgG